jgi:leukotriene-A4 hydrolase
VHFIVDFDNKKVDGEVTISFKALEDGEVIILDTKSLIIKSIKDNTGNELDFKLDNYYRLESHGVPLKIYKDYSKDDTFDITIEYSTTKDCMAIDWLEPEQTSGGKYPFMYSQCQSILCREMLPIQDTPAIKMPVQISITVPEELIGLAAGLFVEEINNGNNKTFIYALDIPIPSYLIAIAAGDIGSQNVSERCTIYAEKTVVEKAAWEFSDTEKFLKIAENYIGEYVWEQYNILVLPPSFPFGGMENPTLTFLTPSLIAGDKSLVSVVAHEISHSWTGNLVTNENWPDFWLNEGFTMFIERKILSSHKDKDMAKLDAMVGLSNLKADIIAFGESKSFSSLEPNLLGRNPDDAFNKVPYEKGFNLLYYLENKVNNDDIFQKFMRSYIDKFKKGVVKYMDFRTFFETFIKNNVKDWEKILNDIDWDTWVFAPGFPPVENDFSNKYADEVDQAVKDFYENKLGDDFVKTFKDWFTLLKQNFLNKIKESDIKLSETQLEFLNEKLELIQGKYNVEVSCSYYLTVLYHGTLRTKFEESLVDFLGKHGRINYIRPLFSALARRNKELAIKTLDKYRNFYHSIIIKYIEIDLKSL